MTDPWGDRKPAAPNADDPTGVIDCDLTWTAGGHSTWRQRLDGGTIAGALIVDVDAIDSFLRLQSSRGAREVVTESNDNLLAEVDDSRVRVAIIVPTHDPRDAALELRRLAARSAVGAITMPLLNFRLSDRRYSPIYEVAVSERLPILIHAGPALGKYVLAARLPGGGPDGPVEQMVDLPTLAWANISSLVLNGTFDRFPDLRVVFSGFGFAWSLPMSWRLDQVWVEGRADAPWVNEWPRAYLRRHVRFASGLAGEYPSSDELVYGLEHHFADVVCLGLNGARLDDHLPRPVLDTLTPSTRAKVLRDNARSLFWR